jgi:hypothetical protein
MPSSLSVNRHLSGTVNASSGMTGELSVGPPRPPRKEEYMMAITSRRAGKAIEQLEYDYQLVSARFGRRLARAWYRTQVVIKLVFLGLGIWLLVRAAFQF